MITSFERRLTIVSAVLIGGSFVAVMIALALFAFSVYVGSLSRDVRDAIVDVRSVLAESGPPDDARVAARRLTAQFFSSQIRITLLDQRRRVEIDRLSATTPYTVVVLPRNDVAGDYPVNTFAARSTLALATLFGLNSQRTVLGPLLIVVHIRDNELVREVVKLLPTLVFALICAVVLSIVFARLLVHEALRPLNDVTAALERFAAGDLTPRAIPAHAEHQLQNLTQAYNGAIAQMQRAFGERDDAHEAMRQFMADAGHQLRTPLTVIRGFIGVLLRGDLRDPRRPLQHPHDDERPVHADGLADREAGAARRVAARGPGCPARGRGRVAAGGRRRAADCRGVAVRTVELNLAPGAMARIDPIGCSHALTNLVDNALKYAPESAIAVTLDVDGRDIRIVIADQGPGMTDGEMQHIFDRFYRGPLRRDVAGSGLGLPIARSAVERAHGTLEVESAPGRGARFTIRLPTAHVDPPAAAGREDAVTAGESGMAPRRYAGRYA